MFRRIEKAQQQRTLNFRILSKKFGWKNRLKSNPFWDFSYETAYETVCFLTDAEIKDLTALILIVWTVSKRGVIETLFRLQVFLTENL